MIQTLSMSVKTFFIKLKRFIIVIRWCNFISNDSHNEMDNDGTSGYPSNDNDSINDDRNVDQDD